MPTQRINQSGGVFVLSEPGKAVTFWPTTESIDVLSTNPHGSLSPYPIDLCEYLHGAGYCDGSSVAGDKLRVSWEDSSHDNLVIWDELLSWFDSYFPDRAA